MPSPRALVATPYRIGVIALLVITIAWRAWTVSRWTWQFDDWMFIELSQTMPFWSYLIHDQNGHLMPGGFLVTKLVVESAPFSFVPVVVVVAIASAVNVAIWGRAFELITGGKLLALAPLSLVALSPVLLIPMSWWAVAVNALPLQIGSGVMIIIACRWAQQRETKHLLWMACVFSISLFFWHKCLFVTIPTIFTIVAMAAGTWRERILAAIKPGILLTVIALPYLWVYRALTDGVSSVHSVEMSTTGHSASSLLSDLARGATQIFLPAMFGGPWGSMPTDADADRVQSSSVTILVLVMTVAILVWSLWRRPAAAWLLALPATYLIVALSAVILTTRSLANFDSMTTDRYFTDAVAVGALTMCLIMASPPRQHRAARQHFSRPAVATLIALTTSLVVANVAKAVGEGVNPGREWPINVRADVSRLTADRDSDNPLVLANGIAPPDVFSWGEWGDSAQLRKMLVPFAPAVAFNRSTDALHLVTEDGNVTRAVIRKLSEAEPGPVEQCGYALQPGERVTVQMSASLFSWPWGLRITGFSADGGDVTVGAGTDSVVMRMPPGLTAQEIEFVGAIPEQITLQLAAGGSPVCVAEVIVGALEVS